MKINYDFLISYIDDLIKGYEVYLYDYQTHAKRQFKLLKRLLITLSKISINDTVKYSDGGTRRKEENEY